MVRRSAQIACGVGGGSGWVTRQCGNYVARAALDPLRLISTTRLDDNFRELRTKLIDRGYDDALTSSRTPPLTRRDKPLPSPESHEHGSVHPYASCDLSTDPTQVYNDLYVGR